MRASCVGASCVRARCVGARCVKPCRASGTARSWRLARSAPALRAPAQRATKGPSASARLGRHDAMVSLCAELTLAPTALMCRLQRSKTARRRSRLAVLLQGACATSAVGCRAPSAAAATSAGEAVRCLVQRGPTAEDTSALAMVQRGATAEGTMACGAACLRRSNGRAGTLQAEAPTRAVRLSEGPHRRASSGEGETLPSAASSLRAGEASVGRARPAGVATRATATLTSLRLLDDGKMSAALPSGARPSKRAPTFRGAPDRAHDLSAGG